MPSLRSANLALLALLVIHTLDHAVAQDPRELPGSSSLVGALGFAITGASAFLAVQRSWLAPAVSLAVGVMTTVGVFAIHLMPSWSSWISDSYWDFDASAGSWVSLLALLAAALYLTYAGYRHVRHARLTEPAPI